MNDEIYDWLGKTTLENDIVGRLTKVTDYQNRTVVYEYNAIGEKTKLVYPDGRVAAYTYDAEGKLSGISGNGEETTYSYDELGRLSLKLLPNGVSTEYSYLPGGNLESMTSYDSKGELDKYFYTYDNAGLISGINRNRRDFEKVSGQYKYSYDAIGRLTTTAHDGMVKSAYEYDAFGNRTLLAESETRTSYTYDVLDRLVQAKELNNSQAIVKSYEYDKRGNQTKEYVDGLLQKTFTFDATNMLSKVVDSNKGEVENEYNGLGFRVASTRPEEKIEYLCDLSRDYYNLLERTVNGETESFIYDNNVVSMSKSGNNYYYLQDELGSPMHMTGTDGVAVSSYAFDDFGRNVDPFTGKIKEANHKHSYTTDGNIIQPFAFTGYQEDEVSGLKFAQARFYDANTGRFQSEDNAKGCISTPFTTNHYGYCWDNPIGIVDIDGNIPKWAKTALKVTACVGIAAVGAAAVVVTCGAAAPAVAAIAAGTISASTVGTVVAAGAICGGVSCLTCQSMEMVMGSRKSIDNSAMVGSMVGGGAMGLMGPACTSLGATMMAGGVSGATGDIAAQAYRTKGGPINAKEVAVSAAGGALLAGAGYGVAKAMSSPGKVVTNNSESTCPTEAGGADFYVYPDGQCVPGKGYRYMDSRYADITMEKMEAPGSYFGFEEFNSAAEVQDAFQIAPHWSDCRVRGTFDTLQVLDEMYIPKAYGDEGPGLEPFTRAYQEYGRGGHFQLKYNGTIKFNDVSIIGE